jgi:hypothetical protein
MAEWRNGGMAEWRNGGMAKKNRQSAIGNQQFTSLTPDT